MYTNNLSGEMSADVMGGKFTRRIAERFTRLAQRRYRKKHPRPVSIIAPVRGKGFYADKAAMINTKLRGDYYPELMGGKVVDWLKARKNKIKRAALAVATGGASEVARKAKQKGITLQRAITGFATAGASEALLAAKKRLVEIENGSNS